MKHHKRIQTVISAGLLYIAPSVVDCGHARAQVIADISGQTEERQVTTASHGHIVANYNIWSPDSKWIAYDCRNKGEAFDATRIECVNADTGEVRCIYEARNGATCGVATWHPGKKRVVFILGPDNPARDWSYAPSRRRGLVVDLDHPGEGRALDAMNYAPPFAPGALRGGSHVHVFDGAGEWVSFTYDDEILRCAGGRDGAEPNQRNIGVAAPFGPVRVNRNHPRNHDGGWFAFVASKTVAVPAPGSDEISQAAEEGWIGANGYIRADGSRQRRALAFQGMVTARNGHRHAEVFVLDLPEDPTIAGGAPLQGTGTTRPSPPRGAVQRRITYTDDRKHPGIQGPRHWLRSSPDGAAIAFLMKDDSGTSQLHIISPHGGGIRQVTRNPWAITSTFTWSPDGRWIAYAMDNSIFVTEVTSGRAHRLTARTEDADSPHRSACVFSPDGRRIAYLRKVASHLQIFTVTMPDPKSKPTVY